MKLKKDEVYIVDDKFMFINNNSQNYCYYYKYNSKITIFANDFNKGPNDILFKEPTEDEKSWFLYNLKYNKIVKNFEEYLEEKELKEFIQEHNLI